MTEVLAPVSIGELIDKITILKIKRRMITDSVKLANIGTEMTALLAVCEKANIDADSALARELEAINLKLWKIEDDIRDLERAKRFDSQFVELARAVYVTNDERFAVKSKINNFFGSHLKEEKSYQPY
jgi:Family of unknown function (DUF6165)